MGKKSRAKKERKAFEAITAGMSDLGSGAPTFDEFGWPDGPAGSEAARSLLHSWMVQLNEQGWDLPHGLMVVNRPDVTAANFAAEGIDVADVGPLLAEDLGQDADSLMAAGVMETQVFDFDPHPVAYLWGSSAPEHASAVAIAMEMWISNDQAGGRPSERPDREEGRAMVLLTRSGIAGQLVSVRGQDEELWSEPAPSPILLTMHQFLGVELPASWPRLSVQQYVGVRTAQESAAVLGRYLAASSDPVPSDVAAAGFILGVAMKYLWALSGRGAALPLPDRTAMSAALEDASSAWVADEQARQVLVDATRRGLAQRTWSDFISSADMPNEQAPLPDIPGGGSLSWASEDMLQALAATVGVARADEALAELSKKDRKAALAMLDELGLT